MNAIYGLVLIIVLLLLVRKIWHRNDWKNPSKEMSIKWKEILLKNVAFYNSLCEKEKPEFEYRVQEFLLNCRITGIQTNVDDTDRLLVASSAVIPVFAFPGWKYVDLFEVLLYPAAFNDKFQTGGDDCNILGVVGTGLLEGKMILSKPALHHGFDNESDRKNTAIHEFVHLIDKGDGVVDGVPELLLEHRYSVPWLELVKRKMHEIYIDRSDINPYGNTNTAEFFSVASEYFFERPNRLASNHPELYSYMVGIFNQDLTTRRMQKRKFLTGRNDPCICGSGRKFKHCCGKNSL